MKLHVCLCFACVDLRLNVRREERNRRSDGLSVHLRTSASLSFLDIRKLARFCSLSLSLRRLRREESPTLRSLTSPALSVWSRLLADPPRTVKPAPVLWMGRSCTCASWVCRGRAFFLPRALLAVCLGVSAHVQRPADRTQGYLYKPCACMQTGVIRDREEGPREREGLHRQTDVLSICGPGYSIQSGGSLYPFFFLSSFLCVCGECPQTSAGLMEREQSFFSSFFSSSSSGEASLNLIGPNPLDSWQTAEFLLSRYPPSLPLPLALSS